MKKLIFILLISLGLQAQAQTLCDSLTFSGTQYSITFHANIQNIANIFNIPNLKVEVWETTDPNGNVISQDTLTNYHSVFLGTGINTITTCLYELHFEGISCCETFMWNGFYWVKTGTITNTQEFDACIISENKIYDILGRELKEIPKNKLYIKNNKIYLND